MANIDTAHHTVPTSFRTADPVDEASAGLALVFVAVALVPAVLVLFELDADADEEG